MAQHLVGHLLRLRRPGLRHTRILAVVAILALSAPVAFAPRLAAVVPGDVFNGGFEQPSSTVPPDLTGSWQSPSAYTCPPWSLSASGPGLNTLTASWHGCEVHAAEVGSFQGTLSLQSGAFVYTGTFQVSEGSVSNGGTMSFTIVSQNEFLLTYHQSNGTSATNQTFTRVGPPELDPLQPAPKLGVRAVLLRDSFADNRNGWYTDKDDFFQGHTYHIRNMEPGRAYRGWAQHLRLGDAYSFAATIQLIAGSVLNNAYGLDFLDHSSTRFELYVFAVDGNGYYGLWHVHRGSWVPIIPWTRTDLVDLGYTTNRLRVDVLQTAVALYLNGQHLADAQLPHVLPGPSTVGFVVSPTQHIVVSQAQVTALIGLNRGKVPVKIKPSRPVPRKHVSRPVQVALQRAQPAVAHISVTSNNNAGGEQSGTGFLILSDPTGAYVVTAAHVVGNVNSMTVQKRVTIVLQNGHSLQPVDLAEGTPNQGDVAVIKVRPQKGLAEAVAKFVPTSQVQVGDVAWAIGYLGSSTSTDSLGGSTIPLGLGDNNGDAAITQPGLVSNIGVKLGGISYLTTSATLVEGMSGGPLVFVGTGDRSGLSGCVIGIDAAYAGAVRRGGQFPNLNLVLPSDTVLPLIQQLLARFHPLPIGSVGSC